MSVKITGFTAHDIRFPTSQQLDGSDAMNPDPDYSAAYVQLHTSDPDLQGFGLTFTIGRGTELCVAAISSLSRLFVGLDLDDVRSDPGSFWRHMTGDSQMRWLGPDKGVVHLATAAVVNAVWDLMARQVQRPVWRMVAEMTPAELVRCIDFRYITDLLTPDEARELLEGQLDSRPERIEQLERSGYPSYTTSAGWLGYSDDQLRDLCRSNLERGWTNFKIKVGRSLEDDIRRCRIMREEIGPDRKLMLDANQVWDVDTAIEWVRQLAEFNPWFIEEPTSPDDVLGHARIAEAIHPIRVATGEQCQNRVLFKQFLQAGGMQVCQLDSCRLAGVNEVLAVQLMAAKSGVPVCPHAGGVGLCEYVQHLAMIDFVCVSGTLENRLTEYSDHLHEHFVEPIRMRDGHYLPPTAPGYSAEMRPEAIAEYAFPDGNYWRSTTG